MAGQLPGIGEAGGIGLAYQEDLAGAVVPGMVGIGEIEPLLPLGKPAEAGDGHVHIPLGHGILTCLEAHGHDLQLHAKTVGQITGQLHIKAHKAILAGL